MKETKPFYKTSEFWLHNLGQLVLVLQESGVITVVAAKYNWIAPILQTLLAMGYINSRGNAKSGIPYATDSGIEEFTQPGTNLDVATPIPAPAPTASPSP
jgi:hypothetical protein